jgi:hypothetical protein
METSTMPNKDRWTWAALYLSLSLFIFAALPFHSASALTSRSGTPPPDFRDFIHQVQNGEADVLRGVYAPGVFALPVTQQPAQDPNYVSNRNGEATEFSLASQYGNVGLLAHNTLSGRSFSELAAGQEVRLVYGDGNIEYFVVTEVLKFQALQPKSTWSRFRPMNGAEELSAGQVFERVYSGDRHVTFQTCIRAYGDWNWGRLFVLAMPLPQRGGRLPAR